MLAFTAKAAAVNPIKAEAATVDVKKHTNSVALLELACLVVVFLLIAI